MRVFVTGGTGAVGMHAVPALIRDGHQVTALARTPEKAAALRTAGADPVIVSLFDRSALTAVLHGHDAVVNLASALPSMARFMTASAWRACTRIRTEGSATVVDAATDAGVPRVIQESVSMLYHDRGSTWVTEDDPVEDYPIARGNHAAEASARRFGGTGVVLRFGWFYGDGAAHAEQLFALARKHIGFVPGPPDTFVSSIHVADAGAAVSAALGVPAGTYNIVDDEPLTKRDFAGALAAAAGRSAWVRVPGRAGLLLGDRLTSLTRSLRVSNAAFRAASGWAPRYPSAREGWRATAEKLLRP